MFNMFVVALVPFKSSCYFFIYLPCKKYRTSPLDLYFETVISCMIWLETPNQGATG